MAFPFTVLLSALCSQPTTQTAKPLHYSGAKPQSTQAAWVHINMMISHLPSSSPPGSPPALRGSDFSHQTSLGSHNVPLYLVSLSQVCPLHPEKLVCSLCSRFKLFGTNSLAIWKSTMVCGFSSRASVIFTPTCLPSKVHSVLLPLICHC